MNPRTVSSSLLGLFLATFACYGQNLAPDKKSAGGRHALLIGCTHYPNLDDKFQLKGPANDIPIFAKVLGDLYGFDKSQIVALSEADGKARGKDYLPTRSAIEREFKALAQKAKAGDHVVILMAGHGSQQPEPDNPTDPEPDGLDEIFLPRDAGTWDGSIGKIENAIVDDEIAGWLKAIRAKNAFIWILFDCCHSGTMIRDQEEVSRSVSPEKGLKIPAQVLLAAQKKADARFAGKKIKARGGENHTGPVKAAQDGGIVALYAAQPQEVTLERVMPPRTQGTVVYGLFSYTICQMLTQAAKNQTRPLTYEELLQGVFNQYMGWGRTYPTPLIEGEEKNREILGNKAWTGRSAWLLTKSANQYRVNAGTLQGLTRGSILAVYPPLGQGDKIRGHVKVSAVTTLAADVEPIAHDGTPLAKDLPEEGVCQMALADWGDVRLKVAADSADGAMKTKLAELVQQASAQKGSLFAVAPTLSQADWVLRGDAQGVFLVPGTGHAGKTPTAFAMGKIEDAKLAQKVDASLQRIVRADMLKRMVRDASESAQPGGLKVEIAIQLDKGGKQTPLAWKSDGFVVHDDDALTIRIKNAGTDTIDVTILYIDSQYGIKALYPPKGRLNRLEPKQNDSVTVDIAADEDALEHLVVIAVKGEGPATDFVSLEQPVLDAKPRATSERGLKSPFGAILQKAMYGPAGTRAVSAEPLSGVFLSMTSWKITPERRR